MRGRTEAEERERERESHRVRVCAKGVWAYLGSAASKTKAEESELDLYDRERRVSVRPSMSVCR